MGCLLVRDGARLREAHTDTADYLQDLDDSTAGAPVWNPADPGPELSRSFRGLRHWLPLMLHGAGAFRAALAEKLALARRFRRGLVGLPLEVPVEPELSVVVFRLPRRAGEALSPWNERNRTLNQRINDRQRVHLSSTTIPVDDGDAFTLRICVLCFRTHEEHIDHALEDLRAALEPGDL